MIFIFILIYKVTDNNIIKFVEDFKNFKADMEIKLFKFDNNEFEKKS